MDHRHNQEPVIASRLAWLSIVFCLLLAARGVAGNRSESITVEPGLIEIRLTDVPDAALVEWEPRQPVIDPQTLKPVIWQYRSYEHDRVFVTYATKGPLVIRSEVTDWDSRTKSNIDWIVNIAGDVPTPPTPPPPTPPTPPAPDSVPNKLGVGKAIYLEAKRINQPASCKSLASQLEDIALALHEARLIPKTANQTATAAISSQGTPWNSFTAFLAAQFSPVVEKYGGTQGVYKSLYHEAALALEAAAK